jgi:dolichyl-phosphate-mannose-protein mannosyltransferase
MRSRWALVSAGVVALFGLLRGWRIGQPPELVFDETQYVKMAHGFVTGPPIFDSHPPLGKLLLAAGELAVGDTPLGWRIAPLLAGLAMMPAAYWACQELFRDRRASAIAATLVAMDGLFIVYSRTGLLDGFLVLFGLVSVAFCFRSMNQRRAGSTGWSTLLLAGTFAGLAVAIKWIGAGFVALVAVASAISLQRAAAPSPPRHQRSWLAHIPDAAAYGAALVVLPTVVYLLPFLTLGRDDFLAHVIDWHQQAWGFNVTLTAGHPYASPWWTWPLLVRPVWFYYTAAPGAVTGIVGIGNPIVWWTSTAAIAVTAVALPYARGGASRIAPHVPAMTFLLVGWIVFLLPWMRISRIAFLYHYLASYILALLLTAFWLSRLMDFPQGRRVAAAALAVMLVTALAFTPLWIAHPISPEWYGRLMWFRSWI